MLAFITLALPAHASIVKVKLVCDMDKAVKAGKYGEVHPHYTKKKAPKAKCKDKQKVEVIVVQFEKEWTDTSEIRSRIKKDGCRQATWPELLALGATVPNLQKRGPIVALGSSWPAASGGTAHPKLGFDENERHAGFADDMGSWDHRWSFAIVCREPKK